MTKNENRSGANAFGFRLRHFVLLAVLTPTILAFIHFTATNSDAFDAADSFARSNTEISKRVGVVATVKLNFWDGFDIAGSGAGGNAEFVVDVGGERGEAKLDIRLQRKATQWVVEEAFLKTDAGPLKLSVQKSDKGHSR